MIPSLIQSESGGNWNAYNDEIGAGGVPGHGGRLQFGAARLQDAANAGVVPLMSPGDFAQAPPEVQMAVENWHFQDIDSQAAARGLTQYYGQTVGGVPINQNALRAMAHLGGIGGAERFLESGGQYNPSDVFGTSLLDYAQMHGGSSEQSAPVANALRGGVGGNASPMGAAGQPMQMGSGAAPVIDPVRVAFGALQQAFARNRERMGQAFQPMRGGR